MDGRRFVDQQALANPFLEERHRKLRADASAFAAGLRVEESDEGARRLVREIGKGGWLGWTDGKDLRSLCVLREVFAETHGLIDLAFAMQGLGTYALEVAGSEALKQLVLPRVRSGEWVAAFAVTEPEAGSDLGALSTRAEAKDGGYVLHGLKTFISNAPIADVMTVLARTDPAAGTKGISMFVVLKSDGVKLAKRQEVVAFHPIGELAFDGVKVGADRLVGKAGEGYKTALAVLETYRTSVAAAALGMAARAVAETIDRVKSRRQFGAPLAEQPVIRSRVAEMIADLESARLAVYRSAAKRDGGAARIPLESALAKLTATELAQKVIDSAVQLHGGFGVTKEAAVERLYREIRTLRIYEGTTEILKLVIGAHVLS